MKITVRPLSLLVGSFALLAVYKAAAEAAMSPNILTAVFICGALLLAFGFEIGNG